MKPLSRFLNRISRPRISLIKMLTLLPTILTANALTGQTPNKTTISTRSTIQSGQSLEYGTKISGTVTTNKINILTHLTPTLSGNFTAWNASSLADGNPMKTDIKLGLSRKFSTGTTVSATGGFWAVRNPKKDFNGEGWILQIDQPLGSIGKVKLNGMLAYQSDDWQTGDTDYTKAGISAIIPLSNKLKAVVGIQGFFLNPESSDSRQVGKGYAIFIYQLNKNISFDAFAQQVQSNLHGNHSDIGVGIRTKF